MRFHLDPSHHAWARSADPAAAVARTIGAARVADEAGIAGIWVSEDPDGWDAFATLGALARETARAQLGTGVTNPFLRHPNLLAASVATLDRLSGGRAFVGLGRGQPEWYRHGLGIAADDPLAALDETVGLLRAWWDTGRASSPGGGIFGVRDWERSIGPVQTAPPVYLAAVGPKALALAGRVADGVLFNDLSSAAYLATAIGEVRASATAAGRDAAALRFFVRAGVTVTDDPEPILEREKGYLALVNTLPGMERGMRTPGFDVDAIVAGVRRAMRTEETLAAGGGFPALRRAGDLAAAKALIPTALVAELAVVGPLPEVRARLAGLARIGVTDVFVGAPKQGEDAEAFGGMLAGLVGR